MGNEQIYHITENDTWLRGLEYGAYKPTAFERDGFIHCSSGAQVLKVANSYYRGQSGLVLLEIDTDKVAAGILWENLEGGEELFPHIYGALNLEAVKAVRQLEPGEDGKFEIT